MDKQLCIIGSGGHSRSVISLLQDQDIDILGIYDDSYKDDVNEIICSIKLVGKIKDINGQTKIVLALGNNEKRKDLFDTYLNQIYVDNIFHSRSFIEGTSTIGRSNLVFGNVFINTKVEIGDNNIINTGAILEHEVIMGSHNHISVGSIICGRVKIGNNCFIGAGAVINDQISICDGVTIGSNSVVIKSIEEPGVYAGNPVYKIDKKSSKINE